MKFHLPTISQFAALMMLNFTNAVTQLLLISILIHHGDNEKLGKYFIVISFSVLASIFVNFGTSQTSVIEIRKSKAQSELEMILSNTLALRFFPLMLSLLAIIGLSVCTKDGWLFLLVIPTIVAELINPQVHLIANYNVSRYAFLNVLMRLLLIFSIYMFRDNPMIIEFAIVFPGLAILFLNLLFFQFVFVKNGALNILPNKYQYFELVKTNWLVLGNSIAVHLQQSMFLFALPSFVTPIYLSAYGFIDKLISSFRMVINAYSAAIIPNATQKYLQGLDFWKKMKLQQNVLLASFCLVAGVFMYFFPDQIIAILLFGKKENSLFINQTVELLRFISPVPLLIALNVLNVLELFLEKKYIAYFGTGLFILVIAMSSLVALKLGLPQFMTGFYPLLIEGASCIITWLIVNKIRNEKSKFLFFFILVPLFNWAQADLKRDNIFLQSNIFKDSIQQSDSFRFITLPVVTSLQNVGHHPTNWNNGSMIPATGAQQYLRGGLKAKWKSFELQLAPEVIIAKNPYFETLSSDMDNLLWRSYYNFYNSIELPVQMGENPYQIIRLGQSFLSYRHKKISFAISNENKWWGPAERNALLLSTSSAGFPHISINSNQPIQTKYFNLDFEVLYGHLINGGWAPPESYKTLLGNPLYYSKPNQTRQIIGSNITINPKWFKNLSLGFAQTYVQYTNDMHQFQNWLPIKSPFVPVIKDNPNKPILLSTFNFSYKLPKAAAEIYGEWGWNLSQTTFRNWFLQPDHGFASTFGLKKVFHTNTKYDWDILAEMTQLQLLTRADQFTLNVPPSWYISSNIRQGYTNDGKLLGAGVGPGGSSQFFEINRRHKQNRIGLAFERRVHNNDLYQYMFVGSQDFRRFYVDFSTTLKIDWKIGNWQIGPRIAYINTNNYYWWLFQTSDYYFITGRDLKQFTTQLNLIYHF